MIVPVYKVEKYIDRCVRSILGQTYADFELILVDDGSPDNSPAMCDAWAGQDSRIRVIHKENGGLSSARNAGMEIAVGEYFHFVDSDDVIHPDCLQILTTCIRRTGAEIAMGRFARFREDTVPADRFTPWDGSWVTRTNLETLDLLFVPSDNIPALTSACGTLWHRRLFDGIPFPVGRLFEDEFVTYKLYHKAGKVAFVDTEVYFYFDNSDGITRNLTVEKRFDEYDAQWDLIACRTGAEPLDPERKKRFEQQYVKVLRIAKSLGCVDFLKHYDYYVLAYPRYTLWLRIRRTLLLLLNELHFPLR